MSHLITIFLNSVISQLQHGLNPAAIEVIKVLFVSFAWIGGLSWFMIRKDKRKQQATL